MLFQAAGAALFLLMFGARLRLATPVVHRLVRGTALAAIPLIALHQTLDAARMADDLSGIVDAGLVRLAWQGASGLAAVLQMAGLALVAWQLRTTQARPSVVVVLVGVVAATVADVLTGHVSVHRSRALLMPLLSLHLLLVAFWFGALLPLIRCCGLETPATAVAVLRSFSTKAGYLVPCLGLAGIAMALILMPHRADWQSPYALLVISKIALFAVLLLLAAWNRWRGVPAANAAPASGAIRALQRVIASEYALIVAVMAVTATMTTLYSPQ